MSYLISTSFPDALWEILSLVHCREHEAIVRKFQVILCGPGPAHTSSLILEELYSDIKIVIV